MMNNINSVVTPTMIRSIADDFEKTQHALNLSKKIIMSRYQKGMSTTEWTKELGGMSNKVHEAFKLDGLLEKTDGGWRPKEMGKDYFTDKKAHTPILKEKGAKHIVDMLCDGRLQLL